MALTIQLTNYTIESFRKYLYLSSLVPRVKFVQRINRKYAHLRLSTQKRG